MTMTRHDMQLQQLSEQTNKQTVTLNSNTTYSNTETGTNLYELKPNQYAN